MKAVVLCGGMGMRLREETDFRPKPLVNVGPRPILWHIMKTYAHYGVRDFVLCLGYRGDAIKEYFLRYDEMNNDFTIELGKKRTLQFHGAHEEQDFRVSLVDTGQQAMTGARLKRVERFIDEDTFMLTYGDGLANIDISKLLAFHQAHGKHATITATSPQSRFGLMSIDPAGRVTSFLEKPRLEASANAGYFVFNRKIFDYLDNDDACTLEREPLERLARDGQLAAYRHDGFFYAMDTFREYVALNDMWSRGDAPWKVWG